MWNTWILLALLPLMVLVDSQCLGTSKPAITLSSNVAALDFIVDSSIVLHSLLDDHNSAYAMIC